MNERIKALRKSLGLTQDEFAEKLGIKRGAIANYEIGRNIPIDAVIRLICSTFNVSEAWLRTGEGEMYVKLSRDDEIEQYVKQILKDESAALQRTVIEFMQCVPSDCWDELNKAAERFRRKRGTP